MSRPSGPSTTRPARSPRARWRTPSPRPPPDEGAVSPCAVPPTSRADCVPMSLTSSMPPGWRLDRRLRCALPSAWQWAANRWDPVSGGGNCGFGLHDFSELRVTANDQTGCTAVIHGARYLPVLGAGRTWVAAGWGSGRSAGLACEATGHERAGWRPRRCRANALAMVVRLVAEGERVGLWGVVAGGVVEGDLVPCPDADDDHVGDGLARSEERRVGKECRSRW